MLRTLVNALAAQTALIRVNVCHVVVKRDGLKRTGLDALAATYTSHSAGLLGYRPFIPVYATYKYPAVHLVAVTQFYYAARAGLDTGSACSTFILINHRQTSCGIHMNGIKLTCGHTVTTP